MVRTEGTEGRAYDAPLVVLINRGSASASEIVSSALRDNGRGLLIGERTYGTGTVVSTYDLDDGAAVALGTAFWKTPNGELAWKVGIEPDLEVEQTDRSGIVSLDGTTNPGLLSLNQLDDLQLLAAIEELQPVATG
jgi:carboxyl-terminal processing protease